MKAALSALTLLLLAPGAAAASTETMAPAAAEQASQADGLTLTLGFIDRAIADGRLRSAAELLSRARTRGEHGELRLREAELLLAAGHSADAALAFQSLEAEEGLAARAKTGRAIALIRQNRTPEAESLLAIAVSLDPALARAWSARAVLADQKRDWKLAESCYGRAIAAAPESADAFNNRGYSRLLQGRTAEAEADFQRALRLEPQLAAAATNLRLARGLQGHYAQAFEGSTREDLGRDLNTVGYAALLRGDLKLAEGYFNRALEADPRYQAQAAANLAYLRQLATAAPAVQEDAAKH